ncbi:MAG: GTPase Era [Clostridiales bacterium]|nr:GTPase Era [Clostridiales bacterium]
MHSGFVTIIGKPNAGKSTLINALVGEKVAIVSPKPQTTRNKILGILNIPDYQIVLVDTPGIHTAKNKLDEYMAKDISEAKKSVDLIIIVIDGSKRIRQEDVDFVKKYDNRNTNAILVISKIDDSSFDKLYPQLMPFNELQYIKDIIPISVFKNKNVDVLLDKIKTYIPEGDAMFDEDIYTDKSIKFMVAELIREKMLWLLHDEIPHGVAVEILAYEEKSKLAKISADIICEKQSHKQIIIGKNGSMIKNIGIKAREEIEKLLDKKVMLELFVKVREGWREDNKYVNSIME